MTEVHAPNPNTLQARAEVMRRVLRSVRLLAALGLTVGAGYVGGRIHEAGYRLPNLGETPVAVSGTYQDPEMYIHTSCLPAIVSARRVQVGEQLVNFTGEGATILLKMKSPERVSVPENVAREGVKIICGVRDVDLTTEAAARVLIQQGVRVVIRSYEKGQVRE